MRFNPGYRILLKMARGIDIRGCVYSNFAIMWRGDEGVVTMGKKIREIKDELLADEEFRREYEALEEEFSIAAQLIEARTKANLTQEQVARRMGTTQSVVARLESGHPLPSLRTLRRYASAVGSKVEIRLVRE